MAYSLIDIELINRKAIAIPGQAYVTPKGATYIGQSDGRLLFQDPALRTTTTTTTATPTTTTTAVDGTTSNDDSYFDYDIAELAIVPKELISGIIINNIFTVDILGGAIVPAEGVGLTDPWYEIDNEGCIVPIEA